MNVTSYTASHRHRADLERLLEEAGLPAEGLDPAPDRTVVASEGDRVWGAATVHRYAGGGLLRSVVVAKELRGHGLGVKLTERAIDLARQLGVTTIYLLTETAPEFFVRLGFEVIPPESVPVDVASDVEFTTLCPSSATVMAARLSNS